MEIAGIRPVRIIELINPFRPNERTAELYLNPVPGEYLADCVKRAGMDAADYALRLNDAEIVQGEEAFHRVMPGDVIYCARAAGGGAMRMIAMISVMVLAAAVTGGLGGAVEGMMWGLIGVTDMAPALVSIIGSSIALGGNMLVSAFMGPGSGSVNSASNTYDPTGPKTLAQPGTPVPKAYGTMGWSGNIVSSFVDQDGKDQYLNVLVAFGFGTASNISDIFLNNKPISSFPDLAYQFRPGSNTQLPMNGFDKVMNVYPQEIEMLAAQPPIVVTGTGLATTGLQIGVKFPGGLMRTDSGGNPKEVSLGYKVEVSPSGAGTWTTPIFPRSTSDVYTTDSNGFRHYPYWVVMPTDRYAGSGIVYSTDTNAGAHYPGEPWSQSQSVKVYNIDNSNTTYSQAFQGEWQMTSNLDLDLVSVTDWWGGWRIVSNMTDQSFYDVVNVYGLAAGKWDCRITKWGAGPHNQPIPQGDGYLTDPHYTADAWLWTVAETEFTDLAYPNIVLLGIRALATGQTSGADLQVRATITHDLGADTVLPAALAGFGHDNPALVAYDIIMNPLYGMASAQPGLAVDVPAFVRWAQFCDEQVPVSGYAGAWSSTVTYSQGQMVLYSGTYYVSLVAANTNQNPATATSSWAVTTAATRRRFVFAGVFDVGGSNAWTCLQQVGQMSRAQIIQAGTSYSVVLDAPTDVTQVFTDANIKRGTYSESFVSLDDRATLVEVDFADAERNWRTDLPVSVMTATTINSGLQPKVVRTKLLGCTSRDQAWAWAYFQLLSTETLMRTAKWEAGIESVSCTIGSVVGVQQRQWSLGGRIQRGSTATVLQIDRTDLPAFALEEGWTVGVQHPVYTVGTATIQSVADAGAGTTLVTFTANLPAGRILRMVNGASEATVLSVAQSGGANSNSVTCRYANGSTFTAGQVVTLYDYDRIEVALAGSLSGTAMGINLPGFTQTPTPDAAWFYGQTGGTAPYKTFRVTGLKQTGDFSMEIQAIEYNPVLYEDATPSYGEIISAPTVDASVSNLVLAEKLQYGNFRSKLITQSTITATWDLGPNTIGADIYVQVDGGAWNHLDHVIGSSYSFAGTVGDVWAVRAVGFDALGVPSSYNGAPVATITVTGLTFAPPIVAGFTGSYQSGSPATLQFSWISQGFGISYELRYTPDQVHGNWDTASVVATGIASNGYSLPAPASGLAGLYLIKALASNASLLTTQKNVYSIDPATFALNDSSSGLNGQASIVPSQTIIINIDSLTFDTPSGKWSLTLAWDAQTILRSDGTALNMQAGTMTWTALLASTTTYYLYMCVSAVDGTVHSANGDAPNIPDTAPNAINAVKAAGDGFYQGPVLTVTTGTAAGSGGGHSGGGPGTCPDGRELVELKGRGQVPAAYVEVGEEILGYSFEEERPVYRRVKATTQAFSSAWRRVLGYKVSPLHPVWIDGEWKLPFTIGPYDPEPGVRVRITVDANDDDEHNFYLVGRGEPLLMHNYIAPTC